jgi:hypothetical protein
MIKSEITDTGHIRYIVYDTNKKVLIITYDRKLARETWENGRVRICWNDI